MRFASLAQSALIGPVQLNIITEWILVNEQEYFIPTTNGRIETVLITKGTLAEFQMLLRTDNSYFFLQFSVLLQSTLPARRPTLLSSTVPQSQNSIPHTYPLCPVLIDTHYPKFVVLCRSHTHSHTHNTLDCPHKTGLFFYCHPYHVLITCLELLHAAVEYGSTRYTSCLLLVPQHSGGMMSRAQPESILPGATELCCSTDPSNWLLLMEVQADKPNT